MTDILFDSGSIVVLRSYKLIRLKRPTSDQFSAQFRQIECDDKKEIWMTLGFECGCINHQSLNGVA
ncbi:hypothetical protein BELL_0499g00080 [Botrytis elliptica]|uniref:Uncharacterized protein n=1 Tax=Botrytis elliptica TaxID=278938 RepID=A0A4Z1JLB6_9HELO|nr:hypothetical protein BELL_0499g00080 [Botrytis elliptica]